MKPFNLNKALQGEPVCLRNGKKAIILCKVPDKYKFSSGHSLKYPLKGLSLNEDGDIYDEHKWTIDGNYYVDDSNHFFRHYRYVG